MEIKCGSCTGTGKSWLWCDCWCPTCRTWSSWEEGKRGKVPRAIPCTNCGQTGKLLCRVCSGRGTRTLLRIILTECAACRGMGSFECQKCLGKGSTAGLALCDRCHGAGRNPECPRCRGRDKGDCERCGASGTLRVESALQSLVQTPNLFALGGYGRFESQALKTFHLQDAITRLTAVAAERSFHSAELTTDSSRRQCLSMTADGRNETYHLRFAVYRISTELFVIWGDEWQTGSDRMDTENLWDAGEKVLPR